MRAAVETVARRADGLQRFGAAYRDLARPPPPVRAPVNLARLAADLAHLFAARWTDVALRVSVDPPTLVVSLDGDQIAQALWALLQNAAEVAANVDLAIRAEVANICLQVRDDGPGIASADADAIFRPFFTTKVTGSGVGLAIARQIFRGHGGDLRLDEREEAATVSKGTISRSAT